MTEIAIIGGTGLYGMAEFQPGEECWIETPYGEPSAAIRLGGWHGRSVAFLCRHGIPHRIPPHRVNYRANLWALHSLGVRRVLAVAAVGGIGADCGPGRIVVPRQIVDYTYGRAHTFFEDDLREVVHVDFTAPYTESLRRQLLDGAGRAGVAAIDGGVYGATQGPRLETAAEIDRMARDGCTLVGMTGMPEAVLARELDMEYACCAVVANWAAGRGGSETITMAQIQAVLHDGMQRVEAVLAAALAD